MSTAAIDVTTDYLIDVESPWLNHLKNDILEPVAGLAIRHPVVAKIEAGELPKATIVRLLSDLCWVITGFPEYVSALASRCPKNDHAVKAALLENAFIERDHPFLLAEAVTALGGDGDAILNGPDWSSYQYSDRIHALRMVIEAYVFHRPWIEGMAACAVGVESVVPAIFGRIGEACVTHYGLPKEKAEWFEIHGGEVEMEHGNEGLRVLDKYVAADDVDTQHACIAAASLISKGVGVDLFNEVATW
ncbi:MAG TPA: hypothetical protein DCF45_12720 [Gammaproteobacteria bacterium]|nr:hypothetical protein [Gammaproteobacteria bacterium]